MKNSEGVQCEICKIFSNPCRIRILNLLRKGPKTVSEIVTLTKISQSAVSQHLSMMRLRGVLVAERKGANIRYYLQYPEIMNAYDIMRNVAKKANR